MSSFMQKYYNITRKRPDHLLGYMVAISGCLMEMMCYGIDNSFSTFSLSMQNDAILGFPSDKALTYGNSVATGISPIFGVLAGFLVDRLPPRAIMLTSTLFLFAGLWFGSVAKSVVGLILTFCLFASISCAFMISTGAIATGTWFNKRLSIAQGINFCGGGLGNFTIQPIIGYLVEHYGWRKAFQYTSILCLIGIFASIFSCRRAEPVEDSEEKQFEGCVTSKNTTQEQLGMVSSNTMAAHDSNMGVILNHESITIYETPNAPLQASNALSSKSLTEERGTLNAMTDTLINDNHDSVRSDDNLMHALHTRRLSAVEILRVFMTKEFLCNFFMYFFYAWTFFGLLSTIARYLFSMGAKGTPYENATPIGPLKVSTTFSFWGGFQIFGSIFVGFMGNVLSEPFAYITCCLLGSITCVALAFCRSYGLFALCMSIMGFSTAGVFAIMPTFIVKQFYGPNTGIIMSTIFLGGCVGGFCSPLLQAELKNRFNNSYTIGFVFMGCCMFIPAVLCFSFLSPKKKTSLPFCSM